MNSIEKYNEIVHEWGSWEKYLESIKPMENINKLPTSDWQRCPICDGTGIYQGPGTFHQIPTCPTCKGKRIINTLNGLPPFSGVEDSQPAEETFEDIQVAQALECVYETGDYCWVASRMYKDDGETFFPGVDIKFIDKTSGDRETWIEDYWDNNTWLLGVYRNEPSSMPEAKQAMNEKGIKDFRNFIHKLIQMGWLENK